MSSEKDTGINKSKDINVLPVEVLKMILSNLDDVRDIQLERTDKRFQRAINGLLVDKQVMAYIVSNAESNESVAMTLAKLLATFKNKYDEASNEESQDKVKQLKYANCVTQLLIRIANYEPFAVIRHKFFFEKAFKDEQGKPIFEENRL